MHDIPEADWKVLRELHPVVLERFCRGVLVELSEVAAASETNAHQKYLAVWDLLNRRDGELADVFNDLRRSTALRHIACMKHRGLLSAEEFGRFSSTTRATIETMLATRVSE